MQEHLSRVREKTIIPLLYAIVPLVGLPYLYGTDSTEGKLFLLCKFGIVALLYITHIYEIPRRYHYILGIIFLFMIVSLLQNRNFGVSVLIMIMFLSFATFPVIQVSKWHKKNISLLIGLVVTCISLCIISAPIAHQGFIKYSSAYISYYSKFNPNTVGYLAAASFMYLFFYFDPKESRKNKFIAFFIFLFSLFMLVLSGCRTALLMVCMLVITYFVNKKQLLKPIYYYIFVFSVVSFCLLYCYLWKLTPEIDQNKSWLNLFSKDFFSGREKIWLKAFEGFLSKPLWGNGSEYLLSATGFSSAHNVLLGILVIMGIVPAIGYLYFLFAPKYLLNIQSFPKEEFTIPQLCFIVSIISTSFECSYTDARLNFLFLPFLLLCGSTNRTNRTNTNEGSYLNNWMKLTCIFIAALTIIGFVTGARSQYEQIYFGTNRNEDRIAGNINFAKTTEGIQIINDEIIFEDTYIPQEDGESNKFNAVQIQLYGLDGRFFGTFYSGSEIGINQGALILGEDMETGLYYFRLKGNTNHKDEVADVLVYLEQEHVYSFGFKIQELCDTRIIVTDYFIEKDK